MSAWLAASVPRNLLRVEDLSSKSISYVFEMGESYGLPTSHDMPQLSLVGSE